MTSQEPPEGDEEPGIEQPGIAGFQLPDERRPFEEGEGDALLFIPEGYEGDPLDVRVWTVNAETMEYMTRRRC